MEWIRSKSRIGLILCGVFILGLSLWLTAVSGKFDFDVEYKDRPVISVVIALIVGSIAWLAACLFASKVNSQSERWMLLWIIAIGIGARLALVFSTPMLEIDLYRYIWDGNLALQTGDPYEYAPIEFVQWQYPEDQRFGFTRSDSEKEWLAGFAKEQDAAMQSTMQIMAQHFGQFTSPYPPVSQAVFAISTYSCPDGSSLKTRVCLLKAWLVLFDIATGLLLILILKHMGLPKSLSVIWFWSPLVLKEFANGGHLDSIAVFFSVCFVWFVIKQISEREKAIRWSLLAGMFLALAVGAKLYPIVLAPLWAVVTIKQLGAKAVIPGLTSIALIVALLIPMTGKIFEYRNDSQNLRPMPGLLAFTQSWEMNDFLFMVVVENFKEPVENERGELESPWMVVLPYAVRSDMTFEKAFFIAKLITRLIFFFIVTWLLMRSWKKFGDKQTSTRVVESVFLTLAWFWLLSPTQNPWYWCWAMPFLVFARSPVWYLIGVMTLLYYVRFWFDYSGHDMSGFDFVVPVIEFAPILVLLAIWSLKNRLSSSEQPIQNGLKAKI